MAGGGVVSLDALLGIVRYNGAEIELGGGLNFTGAGVVVAYNSATKMIDVTISGGGGGGSSGHIIVNRGGSDLTARPRMNFVAALRATDNPGAGRTDIDLQLDGGTLSQSASGLKVADESITATQLAAQAVTGAELKQPAARGAELFWDGSAWNFLGRLTGTPLTNASATLQFGTAPQYVWPASVQVTATRALTLGTTGLAAGPMAGVGAIVNIYFLRPSYAFAITVVNGGGGGGTIFTLPAALGKPVAASFYYDGTNWSLAGWEYFSDAEAA